MTIDTNRMNTIQRKEIGSVGRCSLPLALSVSKLGAYVMLDHGLRFVLAVGTGLLDLYGVAEMLLDEQNAATFLLLVADGGETTAADEGAFLRE